ncbi:MAG TPA: acyl-CoA dehydrogenase family protein [Acidimicrobiales bacterium]|jgi:alkylation response protein AidB-like acyl-CoA dehydrogenase|nr:acyl-CoA dehydrogenase family protein [Acidimicrobiales bacterium]
MQFAFTDDQVLFRDTVRDFLANECTPALVRAAWENADGRVPGLWRKLAEMGVVGLTAPERAGGLGMDEVDLVLLLEEAGRAALPEPVAEVTAVAIPTLREHGGERGAPWLERAAAGDALVAVGIAGPYVLHAEAADVLLLAQDDELHLVDRAAVSLTPQRSVDYSRRLASVTWSPSPATRLAAGELGAHAIADAFDRGALAAAAQCVGIAQHLIDVTVDYVSQREQFGKVVGSYQAVKHHLANALLAVEFARPLVYVAAYAVANATPHRAREVSMAKACASDAVDKAARIALQCHGAIGYTFEYDLHLWMKRGWALAATWGDASFHRNRVADALLG